MAEQNEREAFLAGIMQPAYVWRAFSDLPLKNEDMVSELNLPVHLSVGTVDVGMTADTARKLAAQLPDGRVTIYDDLGHFPAYEDADRYNLELRDLAS